MPPTPSPRLVELAQAHGVATEYWDWLGQHVAVSAPSIRAVLAAAREGVKGRVIAVVQPHRYSRLGNLMDEFQQAFNDADIVYVTPVYAAGEAPVEGVDSAALVAGLRQRGHRAANEIASAPALAEALAKEIQPGDMVVCLGAGDITKWAAGLADGVTAAREGVTA